MASEPPGRVLRRLLRLPVLLYRAGLGGLFERRFLLLTHVGRGGYRPRVRELGPLAAFGPAPGT